MSLIATAWVVPSVIGPFIAGGLTQYVSWRWAFLSLVPMLPIPSWRSCRGIKACAVDVRRPGRVRLAAAMAVGAALLQWAGLQAEAARWVFAAAARSLGWSSWSWLRADCSPRGRCGSPAGCRRSSRSVA